MVCCDTKIVEEDKENAKLFQAPKRWRKNVGNVIMARADRKPLYAHHLKVLHGFTYPVLALKLVRSHLQRLQEGSNREGPVFPAREAEI